MVLPELVIFDLYGTLIQFGVKRHPFRRILQWARQEGRLPKADDAKALMTVNGSAVHIFSTMGIYPPVQMLSELECAIEEELDSLTLFDDVLPTLHQLINWQIPIAVCSNLAQPYGAVIGRLLPELPLLKCLSYSVGYIKPEPEIYQWIIEHGGVRPEKCLFVGDTFLADYEGPTAFGFQARHLVRGAMSHTEVIGSLTDVLTVISDS